MNGLDSDCISTNFIQFSSVASRVQLFLTPWTAARQASLSFTNSQSLLKFMFIESVMPCNHLILYHLLLLPSIFPRIRVFSNESVLCISWPTDWSFSFSIILPMNIQDWFPLGWTGVGSPCSPRDSQESSPTSQFKSIHLWRSAFFMVQLSHTYTTTGKTTALTRWPFVGKVMSLLFKMLSRLVITFLPRSKRFLISWLQSPSAVILKPKKINSVTVSIVSPSVCHAWSDGTGCHDLSFLNVKF